MTRKTADGRSDATQKIFVSTRNKTVTFAASELASYIEKMTGRRLPIERFKKGTAEVSGFLLLCNRKGLQKTETDEFDIKTENGLIVLVGNRARSCLYAVYAYLEAQGVRFLRPGPDGEIVPRRKKLKSNVCLHERASYDHRLICIEGAPSIEHALAVVDWMTKRRMNEFQIQLESSLPFWNRWYSHELNPRFGMDKRTGKKKVYPNISLAQAKRLDAILIRELKKRDIDIHLMGHGWTTRALGITALGWNKTEKPVPRGKRSWLALVNGKRDWYKGIPVNTELCYSKKKVFDAVVKCVVDYARQHPEADVLLFVLSDGTRNFCQCAGCKRLSPSDWYAKLVNAISASLSKHRLTTKVSFDAYHDMVFAPDVERINEADNLIFMFSAFYRCYEHDLIDPCCREDYPMRKYSRDELPVPIGTRTNMQLVRQWQACCETDSMLGEYWFYKFLYLCLDEMFVARRVYTDTVSLLQLGFNGLFSCQALRAFYPTALSMTIMAKTLWNRTVNFDDIVDSHLEVAFGQCAHEVRQYLEGITSILKPSDDGHDHLILWANDAGRAKKAISYLSLWNGKLKKMQAKARQPVYRRSLAYLTHHNILLSHVCQAVERYASGDLAGTRAKLDEATIFACDTEQDTQWVLDTWMVNFYHTERIIRWTGGSRWFEEDEKH